jgi:catechol 2,3-dioxygenase-like lactoylglutathione lyase family enzyme
MSLNVQSLDHVTIVIKDLAATRRFYVDILGMREVPRPSFQFVGQWFQAGATQIHTILEAGRAGTAVERNTRGHHFAFLVENAEAAYQKVQELGLRIVSPPRTRPDGAVQVFVQDPDGHLVEFCSVPKRNA